MTALLVAAELLHSTCVRRGGAAHCRPDAKIITDDFLPLAVSELASKDHSAAERVAVITALGALGTDDVLLLLVPFIRGEQTAERIAAVLALERLLDTSPDKVGNPSQSISFLRIIYYSLTPPARIGDAASFLLGR